LLQDRNIPEQSHLDVDRGRPTESRTSKQAIMELY